jgi:hypothetical protein
VERCRATHQGARPYGDGASTGIHVIGGRFGEPPKPPMHEVYDRRPTAEAAPPLPGPRSSLAVAV